MCKWVGSTLLHTLHSKSQGGKKTLFYLRSVHKRVWKHVMFPLPEIFPLIFFPTGSSAWPPGVTISAALINTRLKEQIKSQQNLLRSFASKLMTLWWICKQKLPWFGAFLAQDAAQIIQFSSMQEMSSRCDQ